MRDSNPPPAGRMIESEERSVPLEEVRLPLSQRKRGATSWVKLIRWVRQPAMSGYDFDGTLFPAGKVVSLEELLAPGYPRIPLVLEMAGVVKAARMNQPHGEKRSEYLYVLWQYQIERREWLDLMRVRSSDHDWALDLGQIASRAIVDQAPAPDLNQIEDRIRHSLNSELEKVPAAERRLVLSMIHDELARRICSEGSIPTPFPSSKPAVVVRKPVVEGLLIDGQSSVA